MRAARKRVRRRSIVHVTVLGETHSDVGLGVVLFANPLCVLVPLHLVGLIEDGEATAVVLDGIEHCVPEIEVPSTLERDQVAVLRFADGLQAGLVPIRLPRIPARIGVGQPIVLQGPGLSSPDVHSGHIDELRVHGGATTLVANLEIAPGDSGSPAFSDGRLIGMCQGRLPEGSTGRAIVIAFSVAGLEELRRIRARLKRDGLPSRLMRAAVLAAGAAGAAAIVLWIDPFDGTRDVADIDSAIVDSYVVAAVDSSTVPLAQAIDGFNRGSIAINWWFTVDEHGEDVRSFEAIHPLESEQGGLVRYAYPEDGNSKTCYLQLPDYFLPIDPATFDGVEFVASADEETPILLRMSFLDRAIPPDSDDSLEWCGTSNARISRIIHLSSEPRTYRIPFSDFHVESWTLEQHPAASYEVNPTTLNGFSFQALDSEGVLEIHRVSLYRDPETPVVLRPEALYASSFLASLNDDERELSGLDHAEMRSDRDLFGRYWAMTWASPSPVDLTCFLHTGLPSDAAAVSLILSASEPMTVRVWASGPDLASDGWKSMESVMLLDVDLTPRRFTIPLGTFIRDGFSQGHVPFTPEEWARLYSLILLPSATEGELRVYEVAFARSPDPGSFE